MTEAFYDHLAKTRHQIHQHPEVSEEEHETTVFLKGYLKNLGIEPLNYPLKTGLVAEIGSGYPVIALRADIDALPIKEKTGLPYSKGPIRSLKRVVLTVCQLSSVITIILT